MRGLAEIHLPSLKSGATMTTTTMDCSRQHIDGEKDSFSLCNNNDIMSRKELNYINTVFLFYYQGAHG